LIHHQGEERDLYQAVGHYQGVSSLVFMNQASGVIRLRIKGGQHFQRFLGGKVKIFLS
jgi:hypothetical protein